MTKRLEKPSQLAERPSSQGSLERGNIVLVAAILALAMGLTGLMVSKLVQSRLNTDIDLRMSNYGGTLAQYTAESGINCLLYYWNTRQVAAPARPASYLNVPPVIATYSVQGGSPYFATSNCTYSINITDLGGTPPAYSVVADATASNAAASANWQNITRRVTVTIASGSQQYNITRYTR